MSFTTKSFGLVLLASGSLWLAASPGWSAHGKHPEPAPSTTAPAAKPSEKPCLASREFITTLEFLRAQKDLATPEAEARKIAERVSSGCAGAAGRFIKVTEVLSTAGLTGKNAVQEGLAFAPRTDRETQTFVSVFQRAFLQEYLDLSLRASLELAHSLTTEFGGDTGAVLKDFEALLDFCLRDSGLGLPRAQCGKMASRIARKGEPSGGGISSSFFKTFDYLKSEKGPGLGTGAALALAEQLVGYGPQGPENFTQGFRYALSKDGLGYGAADALRFGTEMAAKSSSKEK